MVDGNLIKEGKIDLFVEELFDYALGQRASDIHLESFTSYGRIRIRVDGRLSEILRLEAEDYLRLVTKIKLMSKMDISEKRRPQDGRLDLEKYENVDFRISSLNTINGEKIVIRVLSLEEFQNNSKLLGFSSESKDLLDRAIRDRAGMIIFSGPTGSGKSTSLYSLLGKLNKMEENIVTVEDPVEYQIDGINQVAVNEKIDFTFGRALRSILRQDPDIIMVGEIRDRETAEMAIRSAITGHLVLTTLHTKNALSSIVRLKDLGVDNYLLSSAISCVASQRLVRRLCSCKREDRMTDLEYNLASSVLPVDRETKIYRPGACDKCHGGYLGREAIEEVFLLNDEMKALIRRGDFSERELKEASDTPDTSIFKAGLKKVFAGETSFDEVVDASFSI